MIMRLLVSSILLIGLGGFSVSAAEINWGATIVHEESTQTRDSGQNNSTGLPGVQKNVFNRKKDNEVCGQGIDFRYVISGVVSESNCTPQQFNAPSQKPLQAGPYQNLTN